MAWLAELLRPLYHLLGALSVLVCGQQLVHRFAGGKFDDLMCLSFRLLLLSTNLIKVIAENVAFAFRRRSIRVEMCPGTLKG